jgi:tetratricopeptide (TPR) repeat protein
MRLIAAALGLAFCLGAPARAQLAVTTFGGSDAAACYDNARNDFSREAGPCDAALGGALRVDDRKKTLVNRGIILNREGRLQDAIDDFNAALGIDGDLAEAYLNRGNSYFLAARYDRAEADYERSLALGVAKPWAAWYNIALVREARGDAAGARDAYESALALNPDFSAAKDKLARLGPAG